MRPDQSGSKDVGNGLGRSLQVIETVARANRPLSIPDLITLLDLPKATVHRLCQRLEQEQFIIREPGGRHYTVGNRLFQIALDTINHGSSPGRHRVLENLVQKIGETCNFTALAGNDVVYLDRVESHWPLRLHLETGSRVPMHCTASGKLFLAFMDKNRRTKAITALELTAYTPASITDKAVLLQELSDIQKQGYSLDREEFLTGLHAIAVPVRNRNNVVVAAVACHAPAARLSLSDLIGHLHWLQDAAQEMTATLP